MRQRRPKVNVVPGLKWCPQCLNRLDRRAFGRDSRRHDGLTGWCKGCRAAAQKRRRDSGVARTGRDSGSLGQPDSGGAAYEVIHGERIEAFPLPKGWGRLAVEKRFATQQEIEEAGLP